MTDLAVLRQRIADLDRQLLALAAERLAVAEQVGAAKQASGLPIRNYATEAEVLARYREEADRRGMEPGFAERVATLLIGEAVRRQEEVLGTVAGTPEAGARRILIVGGAGQMGRWFARFFLGQGHRVGVLDPAGAVDGCDTVSRLGAVDDHDVILLAMPLSLGPTVLGQVLERRPAGLIADISSLKSHLLDQLRAGAASGLRVTSIHPLFGPGVRTLAGRVMAVCDCGNPEATEQAAALFEGTALSIERIPVAQHDEYMKHVLGLSHLVSILFTATMVRSGYRFQDLARMGTTTWWKQVRTAAEVARENGTMYGEIQRLNAHSPELYRLVGEALRDLELAASGPDSGAFERILTSGRSWYPDTVPENLS